MATPTQGNGGHEVPSEKDVEVKQFQRKRGYALTLVIPTGKFIRRFYSESVITYEEMQELITRRDTDKLIDERLAEHLLAMVERKHTEIQYCFLKCVREQRKDIVLDVETETWLLKIIGEERQTFPPSPRDSSSPSSTGAPRHRSPSPVSPSAHSTPPSVRPPSPAGHTDRSHRRSPSSASEELPSWLPSRESLDAKAMLKVSDTIYTLQNCTELAIYLDLRKGADYITSLRSADPHQTVESLAFNVMKKWVEERGKAASPSVLYKVLSELHLRLSADTLSDYYEGRSAQKPVTAGRTTTRDRTPSTTPDPIPPSRNPPVSMWEKIFRPRFSELKHRIMLDDLRSACWAKNFITNEENDTLRLEKNQYKHNELLLKIIMANPDDRFLEFLQVLAAACDGRRYKDLARELADDYEKLTNQEVIFRYSDWS